MAKITFDSEAAYERMTNDSNLVEKLEKRFTTFKKVLLLEEEEVFNSIIQKYGELDWPDYPEQMTRRIFLYACHVPATWDFIQGRRTPAEKRTLKKEADRLEKSAPKIPEPYAKSLRDIICDLRDEAAYEHQVLSFALTRKPTLRGYAIRIVYRHILEVLPCIKASDLICNQQAPNQETACIVNHMALDNKIVTADDVVHAMNQL